MLPLERLVQAVETLKESRNMGVEGTRDDVQEDG